MEVVWVQLLRGGGVRRPTLLLFSFYVQVSGMRPLSHFSSQPLMIPAPRLSSMSGGLERMESDRIAKRVYVGECAGSRSISEPGKK